MDNAVQKVDEILNSDKSPEEKITELEQLRTELQAQLAEQEQEPGSAEQSERTLPVSLERADIERWLTEINPNFDPFDTTSPYDNNCGSCAVAVALTLSGHGSFEATENNVGTVKEMNELTGMEQAPMTPEEIRDHMLSLGPGAHAIVGVDRRDQPGHWFNVLCIDKDTVVALDGQSGEILDWPPDYGDVTNWDVSVKKEDS